MDIRLPPESPFNSWPFKHIDSFYHHITQKHENASLIIKQSSFIITFTWEFNTTEARFKRHVPMHLVYFYRVGKRLFTFIPSLCLMGTSFLCVDFAALEYYVMYKSLTCWQSGTHTYVHIYIHIYTHACRHQCIHSYIQVCIHITISTF